MPDFDFDVFGTAGENVHDFASTELGAHRSYSPISEWEQQLHGDGHEGMEAIPLQPLQQRSSSQVFAEPDIRRSPSSHSLFTTNIGESVSSLQGIARGASKIHSETESPTAHPLSAHLPTDSQDRAQARLQWVVDNEWLTAAEDNSQFNGFKMRDPNLEDGASNLLSLPNVRNDPHRSVTDDPHNRTERAQVSSRVPGQFRLQPGVVVEGTEEEIQGTADIEAELAHPWARTDGHTHVPETGGFGQFRPSPEDQLAARENPHVRFFIKIPDYHKAPNHEIVQYSGAMPLRHYVALPNPHNYSVEPDSPDSYSPGRKSFVMPPFKHAPPGYPGITRYPGPRDDHSLSGSEAEGVGADDGL